MPPTPTPTPSTSHPPLPAHGSYQPRFLVYLNDLVQRPYLEDIFWYCNAFVYALFGSIIGLFSLVSLFLYDCLTGYFLTQRFNNPSGRAILITGCDSGFGLQAAKSLSAKGWFVYAACISREGVERLAAHGGPGATSNLQPILMDVTKEEDIDEAVRVVSEKHASGLFAVINNAGEFLILFFCYHVYH